MATSQGGMRRWAAALLLVSARLCALSMNPKIRLYKSGQRFHHFGQNEVPLLFEIN
jgi:hypothetical protein